MAPVPDAPIPPLSFPEIFLLIQIVFWMVALILPENLFRWLFRAAFHKKD